MPPIRLVVVDDNSDLRFLVRAAVESRGGFEVVGEAGDGREGVAVVQAAQPDLVLLDLDMPMMGGLDALPLLREAAPGAQIVVLSSFRRSDYEGQVRSEGAVGYLEKGLTARQLVDELLTLAGVLEIVDGVLATASTGLPADTQSAGEARRFVDEVLAQWDCQQLLDDVQLLVSELVTNAVVHARSDAQVAVRLLPEVLRIEVVDRGEVTTTTEAKPPTDVGAESGRGLFLVETLASSWGVERIEGGKSVWFEVPRPDTPRVE
jgi:DNA-binding NarL/FixJ family response regulator